MSEQHDEPYKPCDSAFKTLVHDRPQLIDWVSGAAVAGSTASRVGTGSIVGVSVAIVSGGAGAMFWMWLIALLGGAAAGK